MLSPLYWIDAGGPPRIAIMARPRAGDWLEDEVAHWQRAGIGRVASLLERDEVEELGLAAEAALCTARGIGFASFPIRDRGVPADRQAALAFAADLAGSGKPVAIHCRAGIGRSSLMAAAVLAARGVAPAEALAAITSARGLQIPDTEIQRDWILGLA